MAILPRIVCQTKKCGSMLHPRRRKYSIPRPSLFQFATAYRNKTSLARLAGQQFATPSLRARAIGIAVINATGNSGSALSPFMIGWLKDITGSFSSGLWFVAALLVIGAMIIWAIPMKGTRPRATP